MYNSSYIDGRVILASDFIGWFYRGDLFGEFYEKVKVEGNSKKNRGYFHFVTIQLSLTCILDAHVFILQYPI